MRAFGKRSPDAFCYTKITYLKGLQYEYGSGKFQATYDCWKGKEPDEYSGFERRTGGAISPRLFIQHGWTGDGY